MIFQFVLIIQGILMVLILVKLLLFPILIIKMYFSRDSFIVRLNIVIHKHLILILIMNYLLVLIVVRPQTLSYNNLLYQRITLQLFLITIKHIVTRHFFNSFNYLLSHHHSINYQP